MNNSINLQSPKLPKMLSNLVYSNQFLKSTLIAAFALLIIAMTTIGFLATRRSVVLTLAPTGEQLVDVAPPNPENEIRVAIRKYISKRYRWNATNIKQQLLEAKAFILPANEKTFDAETANVVRFAVDRQVSQRAYDDQIAIDLAKRTATVAGDRVTSVQGLKVAGDLKLQLSFDSGPRTQANPWGVYVTKEREE